METQLIKDKQELIDYFKRFDQAEHSLIYERNLKENYSQKFKELLDKEFYSDDSKRNIDNRFVSETYINPSERFLEEYYCGISTFIVINPYLFVRFSIPGIEHNVYEIIIYIDCSPMYDEYVVFKLKERKDFEYNGLSEEITIK